MFTLALVRRLVVPLRFIDGAGADVERGGAAGEVADVPPMFAMPTPGPVSVVLNRDATSAAHRDRADAGEVFADFEAERIDTCRPRGCSACRCRVLPTRSGMLLIVQAELWAETEFWPETVAVPTDPLLSPMAVLTVVFESGAVLHKQVAVAGGADGETGRSRRWSRSLSRDRDCLSSWRHCRSRDRREENNLV